MLSKIEMAEHPNKGSSKVDIVLGSSHPRSGYTLTEITGIGPPDSEINYSSYAMLPGGLYHSSRRISRNIVITIGFDPDYIQGETVQELRRVLYNTIPTGEFVRLRFWDDDSYEMRVDGYLESYSPTMFSKDPEIQISIICPDPFFVAPSRIHEYDLQRGFFRIDYSGSVSTSIEVEVYIYSPTTLVVVEVDYGGERYSIRLHHTFPSGSTLYVNTEPGEKRIELQLSNGSYDKTVLGKAVIEGGWPEIRKGANHVRVLTDSSNDVFNWDLHYSRKFDGF